MNENYFISPKYDFAFKRLFGTKKNEDLLRSFLKASTDLDDSELSDIEFIDPHLNARYNDDKAGTLDVRVKTKENTHIDIEIQICKHNGFKERLTYYVSRMVSDSIRSGEEFGIMSKSIVIAICDFVLFTETSEFKNNFYFMEEQEHFKLTDICKIITLELPKVPKTNDTNKLIQWLRFIKSETKTEAESMLKTDADFKKAWEELEEINGDPELRWEYTSRLLNIMGQQQMRIDAEEMEKALQKADLELEQLHEEIFSATEELNLVKAEAASAKAEADSAKAEADSAKAEADSAKAEALEIKMNTAIQLKQINLPIEQISQITGLSKEKISTL